RLNPVDIRYSALLVSVASFHESEVAYEKPMAILSLGPLACLRNHESDFRRLSVASKGRDHAGELQRARGYAGRRAPSGLLSQTQFGHAIGVDAQRASRPVSFDRW